MPRPKRIKPILKSGQEPKPEDLEEFIREASEVKSLTQTAGWAILERDLTQYRNSLINILAYTSSKRPEYHEARILFIAVDKLFAMVNDYQENRDRAIELLQKLENPDMAVTMDIDNE